MTLLVAPRRDVNWAQEQWFADNDHVRRSLGLFAADVAAPPTSGSSGEVRALLHARPQPESPRLVRSVSQSEPVSAHRSRFVRLFVCWHRSTILQGWHSAHAVAQDDCPQGEVCARPTAWVAARFACHGLTAAIVALCGLSLRPGVLLMTVLELMCYNSFAARTAL